MKNRLIIISQRLQKSLIKIYG
uniref:Uncharacterized protein n=1 Tax=Arundo donax TaxID=35708 RepID=A0A0A9BSB6_ARUDO